MAGAVLEEIHGAVLLGRKFLFVYCVLGVFLDSGHGKIPLRKHKIRYSRCWEFFNLEEYIICSSNHLAIKAPFGNLLPLAIS